MNKLLILAVLSFGFSQLKSQVIEIGQDANSIKQIIEWKTRNHNTPDSYGRHSKSIATWDVLYDNGQIVDVIQCYDNQIFIDLKMSVNYCKHYIMENGKLSYVLTQYENVPIEKLKKLYDSLYGKRKINNLYFDEDYEHCSKIYLAKNRQATIEWRKAQLNQIPLRIRIELEKQKKEK